jgi:hypothetical protein
VTNQTGTRASARADAQASASADARPGAHVAARPARLRLTGRGAALLMLIAFFLTSLLAAGVQEWWLAGFGYLAGGLAAAWYARREALLLVAAGPPALFLIALVAVQVLTAQDGTALATLEGTLLALAAVAPWLFIGTVAVLLLALRRGLVQCVRDLSDELNGRRPLARTRPNGEDPAEG